MSWVSGIVSANREGRLRGPRPFLEHKQRLRCCNLLRVPDEVTDSDRKNRTGAMSANGIVSDVKAPGAGTETDLPMRRQPVS